MQVEMLPRSMTQAVKDIPQGLKPRIFLHLFGPAKAVPLLQDFL
jgi:hypothetical protein